MVTQNMKQNIQYSSFIIWEDKAEYELSIWIAYELFTLELLTE